MNVLSVVHLKVFKYTTHYSQSANLRENLWVDLSLQKCYIELTLSDSLGLEKILVILKIDYVYGMMLN